MSKIEIGVKRKALTGSVVKGLL